MVSTSLKRSHDETDLAKTLAELIKTPEDSWFFEAHPELEWLDFSALEAWECWLMKELSKEDFELYEELYSFKFSDMGSLKEAILIDTNRFPQPGNRDGN